MSPEYLRDLNRNAAHNRTDYLCYFRSMDRIALSDPGFPQLFLVLCDMFTIAVSMFERYLRNVRYRCNENES